MRARSVAESFVFATRGMVYVLRRHRHARLQMLAAAVVLALGIVLKASALQMAALIAAVALVLVAEALNTAIEAAVDLSTPTYSALARAAKDAAGSAVMVASAAAVVTGGLVVLGTGRLKEMLGHRAAEPLGYAQVALVGLLVLAALVAVGKALGGRGSLTRGGAVSLHSGVAAFLVVAVWYLGATLGAVGAAGMLAGLVCQSRVQGGIHSSKEVLRGVGLAVALAFGLFALVR